MRSIIIALVFLISGSLTLRSQVFLLDTTTQVNTCSGLLLDSGGENENYGPSEDHTLTICSDGSGSSHIRLTFAGGVQIASGDVLCFYDGPDINAPLLACANEFGTNQTTIIQATAANSGGCLTIRFKSNAAGEAPGWIAEINCVQSCQPIEALLVQTDPAVVPTDTGWIDICPEEVVHFQAEGLYPQNGLFYTQSDSLSQFFWNFGDGATAVGPQVTHTFKEPGGYKVQVYITDTLGCVSTNLVSQRIRVAAPPTFLSGNFPDAICLGDTLLLAAAIDDTASSAALIVLPTQESFAIEVLRADSIALPDGTGVSYQTNISLDQFLPGQTLDQIEDLEGICLTIEHSWLRDLEIKLTCPNGQTVILHDHPNNLGDEVFLGAPIDDDDTNLMPGIGYEYCWTPDATNGTFLDYANTFDPDTLPAGNYNSFDSLETLLGCPLNGKWTIEVQDLWLLDNGFIFNWGILFNPNIYPNLETFRPAIIDYSWMPNSSILEFSSDSITVSPPRAGLVNYQFEVTDAHGCTYLETIDLAVNPSEHPNCLSCAPANSPFPDTLTVCAGDTTSIEGMLLFTDLDSTATFEYIANTSIFSQSLAGNNQFFPLPVNSLLPVQLDDAEAQIQEVCLTLEYPNLENLTLTLVAPDGSSVLLTAGSGIGGASYQQTCFSPASTESLALATAPYTGTFQAEGDWTVLNGSPLNGDWELVLEQINPDTAFGQLIAWSLKLLKENNFTFSWTPATGISCTDCSTPQIFSDSNQMYYVNAFDSYGCVRADSIFIDILPLQAAPLVTCQVTDFGDLTFSWVAQTGISSFEVNVDQGGWQPSNQPLAHLIEGLTDGQEVHIQVRGIPDLTESCKTGISELSCTYLDPCLIDLKIIQQKSPECHDSSDGFITLNAEGGLGVVQYAPSGGIWQTSAVFSGLQGGNYTLVALDQNGCTDTLQINLPAPPPLEINLTATDNLCFGGTAGSIAASGAGGTGTISYQWAGPSGYTNDLSSITGLSSGNYCLEIIDDNQCTLDTCVQVSEPTEILTNLTTIPASCANSNDGQALIDGNGGTGQLSYNWSNGNSGVQLDLLEPGTYLVTTTDENNCSIIDTATVTAPPALLVDELDVSNVLCFGGNTGEAAVMITGGTPPYTYMWNDSANQQTNPAVDLGEGIYNVTVTDQNGCTIVQQATVSQPNALLVDIDLTDVLCTGDSTGTALANVSGGVSPYTYNWALLPYTGPFANNLAAGDYLLFITDNNGCTVSNNFSIEEPPTALSINLMQTFFACHGSGNSEATATATGGTGIYSYQWSNNQTTEVALNLLPQLYSLTVTDASDCAVSASIFIDELAEIEVGLSAESPKCAGQTNGNASVVEVSGGVGNGNIADYFYTWSTTPVQTGPTGMGLTGNTTYTVTITDDQGCTGISSILIPESEPIDLLVTTNDASCFQAQDGSGTAQASGPNPGFNYQWSANITNASNNVASNLGAGTYAVTVTDNIGCSTSTTFTVDQPAPIFLELQATGNPCYDSAEGTLTATASGGAPNYSYVWSTGQVGAQLSNLPEGNYSVTVTDFTGCTQEETGYVPAPDAISATINVQGITCFGDADGRMTILPSGGVPPYVYSLDGAPFNGVSTVVGLEAGAYSIEIMDDQGCTWLTAAEIPNTFDLNVDAGPDLEIESGDSIQLDFFVGGFIGSYENTWFQPYSGSLSCPDCPSCDSLVVTCTNPFASPSITTTYEVFVTDERGCTASDKIIVRINKDRRIFVPTAFSPNGDNQNERLYPRGKPGTTINLFQVYDRWGSLLFQTGNNDINDPAGGWNGQFRGQDLNSGLVIWYLEATYPDGRQENLRGQTMLIR